MSEEPAPWEIRSLGDLVPVTSRHHDAASAGIVPLTQAAEEAVEEARGSRHGKATRVLWTGPYQRLVVVGLSAGSRLAEHASPPAASFQVLLGTTRVVAGPGVEWTVGAGEVVAIPPDRHSVEADTDCAFLLTVSLDPNGTART